MEQIRPYLRRVYYHETDQMAIMHHSNYIRWMEEGRVDFLRQADFDLKGLEARGILMPVVSVNCKYLVSLRFDEAAEVETRLTGFNGARVEFSYKIYRADDHVLAATGESSHCFVDAATRLPLHLKRRAPEEYQKGLRLLAQT